MVAGALAKLVEQALRDEWPRREVGLLRTAERLQAKLRDMLSDEDVLFLGIAEDDLAN